MDNEQLDTPHKLRAPLQTGERQKFIGKGDLAITASATPSGKRNKKGLHPRTPNKCCSSSGGNSLTSNSNSGSCSSIHMFSTSVVHTPPAKRFQRVRNPFEPVLAERLHLPLIASPSLFQRPTTPQLSSTQFEWTIDEVSSLKPANVEPHETQFQDSPDPEYEAKAQSAISCYFKEQQIVPSPVDCPLRNHRIILSELNSNTPITKPGRRIRDYGTQTELSFPAVLPKALEEALKPYLQPHLALSEPLLESRNNYCDQFRFSSDSIALGTCNDNKDTSLRRKLFDMHNVVVLDNESKTPTACNKSKMSNASSSNSSPTSNELYVQQQHIAIVGKLSDSLDKSSFGSLSPISATDGLSMSPHSSHSNSASKLKLRMKNFLHDLAEAEQLSPIHPPVHSRHKSLKNSINALVCKESYRCSEHNTDIESSAVEVVGGKFTPDRSSSPLYLQRCSTDMAEQHSIDSSFNIKISRLVVNSSKSATGNRYKAGYKNTETEQFAHDDTDEILEEDDEMQVSQLSAQSFNCSSSNSSDTPRSKRRSASRKNLSQSFSLNWLEDEEEEQAAEASAGQCQLPKINITAMDGLLLSEQIAKASSENDKLEPRVAFYRTDSGFNEMPASGSSSCCHTISIEQQQQQAHSDEQLSQSPSIVNQMDVSMVCCSTPSKRTEVANS